MSEVLAIMFDLKLVTAPFTLIWAGGWACEKFIAHRSN